MANGQLSSIYGRNYRPVRQSTLVKDMYGQASADVIARKKAEQEAEERKFDEDMAQKNLNLLTKQTENQQTSAQQQYSYNQAALREQQKAREEQARQAKIGMGIEAGRLGMNMYDRFGKGTAAIGGPFSGVGDTIKSGLNTIGVPTSGIDFGGLASTGLVGAGAGMLAGGDKGKAALYGAGAGLGMSLLNKGVAGGIGGKLFDTGIGALGGFLGSLF